MTPCTHTLPHIHIQMHTHIATITLIKFNRIIALYILKRNLTVKVTDNLISARRPRRRCIYFTALVGVTFKTLHILTYITLPNDLSLLH